MLIPAFTSKDPVLNRYFTTVRYEDEALKRFFEKLRGAGLYDRSVIVLYGDHPGISSHHKRAMETYLGKKITPPDAVALQKVPLIIHIPGITDKAGGKTIAKTGGQADIRPTVLHLLGADTREDIQFGQDLLSTGHEDFAALRDGSFVNRDLIWNGNRCYRKKTGEETGKSNCRQGMEQAARELKLSDKLIYGDLLRFSR